MWGLGILQEYKALTPCKVSLQFWVHCSGGASEKSTQALLPCQCRLAVSLHGNDFKLGIAKGLRLRAT